jgi:hypothetical protein
VKECDFDKRIDACTRISDTTTVTTQMPTIETTTAYSTIKTTSTSTQTPEMTSTLKPTDPSYFINFICNNCSNLSITNNIKS